MTESINYGLLIFCLGLIVLLALMWLYILGLEKKIHRLDKKLYDHLRWDHQELYRYEGDGSDGDPNPMWIDRAVPKHELRPLTPSRG